MKYLIIGLGHYGATLAMELTAMGHEVVGADGNGLHVDSVKDRMAASFVLDATDEMALSVLPLKSVDAVIVAIGDNFGASVRIVSLLKKLKVKRIYARAVDEVHKGVLEAFSDRPYFDTGTGCSTFAGTAVGTGWRGRIFPDRR